MQQQQRLSIRAVRVGSKSQQLHDNVSTRKKRNYWRQQQLFEEQISINRANTATSFCRILLTYLSAFAQLSLSGDFDCPVMCLQAVVDLANGISRAIRIVSQVQVKREDISVSLLVHTLSIEITPGTARSILNFHEQAGSRSFFSACRCAKNRLLSPSIDHSLDERMSCSGI